MSDSVDLALFRGTLEQLKDFCRDCDNCPIRDTCHDELQLSALYGFADRAIEEMNYRLGFSASKGGKE